MSAKPVKPVTMAAVSAAHGITGEVRLKLFGEGVSGLKSFRAFNDGSLTVKSLRDDGKGGAIARFAEVTDRTAAEKLRGTVLTVPRNLLPALGEGNITMPTCWACPPFRRMARIWAWSSRSRISARAMSSRSSALWARMASAIASWFPCASRPFPNGTMSA
jgi:hypothetical protein